MKLPHLVLFAIFLLSVAWGHFFTAFLLCVYYLLETTE